MTITMNGLGSRPFYTVIVYLSKANTPYDLLAPMRLSPGGRQGPAPKISLAAGNASSSTAQKLDGGRLATLGHCTMPGGPRRRSTVSRWRPAAWRPPLDRNSAGSNSSGPATRRQAAAHTGHVAAELTVEAYSLTGVLSVAKMPTTIVVPSPLARPNAEWTILPLAALYNN